MSAVVEQSELLGSTSDINLGDTFTDGSIRRMFTRHQYSLAASNLRLRDVVVDPITTVILQNRAAVHTSGYHYPAEVDAALRRLATAGDSQLRGRQVFMALSKYNNHYHWITECIPAIASYQTEPDFAAGILLMTSERNFSNTMRQSLQLLTTGQKLPSILAVGRSQLPIDELVLSAFLAPQPQPSRFANQVFDRMAEQIAGRTVAPYRRLYVSRLDATRSPLANEPALIALLARHGIELVIAGDLSLAEQICLFRDARLIVGAHGAGLTNIAFSRPGAVLYELFPSIMARRNLFSTMAQGRGIHYWADMFHCPDPSQPTLEALGEVRWEADLAVVEQRLAAIDACYPA